MYFVGSSRDLYSVSVTAVIGAISSHIGPRYDGTRLYFTYPSHLKHVYMQLDQCSL